MVIMVVIETNNPTLSASPTSWPGRRVFLTMRFHVLGEGLRRIPDSKMTNDDFLMVKRKIAFRGSRWRFHLRGSGCTFSASGLVRVVSRSASAYD